ncbi:hypothetical protein ACN28E_25075 [Archangium lansingense]|uniref:hypothetical protein n=1 Tax=Archangium lansingense TaxID=2995310 RepID=UPI003B767044
MHDQRGNRVGPYRLGPRYRDTGALGRVYRAHNAETGAPALVLQRTARQEDATPLADWTVRVTSSVSPAFLALEVESAPVDGLPADVVEEFVVMLGDAEQLANTVADRHETMPHLRRPVFARQLVTPPPTPRPSTRNWQSPSLAAGLAALAATAVLYLGGSRSGLELRHDAGAALAQSDLDAWWGGDDAATGLALTSTTDDAPILLARALPKKPFSNQKRPPCKVKEKLEVELFGGCWVPHRQSAPCPDELYEYEGVCYLPAAKPEKSPTAFSSQPLAFDRQ